MDKIKNKLSHELLYLENLEDTSNTLIENLKKTVLYTMNRKGGVIGISGGIDSSLTLALSVKAFGAENVLGIILPESESNSDSQLLAKKLADKFDVRVVVENITSALKGFECYQRRDQAILKVIPEYNPKTDKSKIVINQKIKKNIPSLFSVTVVTPEGKETTKVLSAKEYLQIVASSNFKQRTRMSMLYYYAESLHYAVIGTPNKHEVEQGFFVKYGDGGADVMPIASLYKSQVYQLAEYLGVPKEIISRTPTTDTYSAEQTQEEFFFQMSYKVMDLITYGLDNDYSTVEIAHAVEKSEEEVDNIIANLERKRKTTDYLRCNPVFF